MTISVGGWIGGDGLNWALLPAWYVRAQGSALIYKPLMKCETCGLFISKGKSTCQVCKTIIF